MKRAVQAATADSGGTPEEGRTLSEVAYRRLRSDILWGRLAPGQPLRFEEMKRLYGLGSSPLREALSRLVSERLVTAIGQRGFWVATVSAEEFRGITRVRQLVEGDALRLSVLHGDVDWESRIVAAFHGLSRVPIPHGPGPGAEEWARLHGEFHAALISACGIPLLLSLSQSLGDQAERYRLIRAAHSPEPDLTRDTRAEHKDIMEAVLRRDADAAVAALTRHFGITVESVNRVLAGIPSPEQAPNRRSKLRSLASTAE